MLAITALDLEQWADRITASSDFPRLISRLIWASAKDLSQLDMPGGELARLSGFDGVVACGVGDDMIPLGDSAWELGVDKNPEKKAEEDYDKRTGTSQKAQAPTKTGRTKTTSAEALGVDRATTTFVAATVRRWPAAEEWANTKRQLNEWRDVRVLWSQHFEQWLARVPWIAAAFAPIIKSSLVLGIESLDMIWLDYAKVALSITELDPSFVIAERTSVGNAFLQWIATDVPQNERVIRISGPSEREVLHYLSATIRRLQQPDRNRYESRIFAVHDKPVAQGLGRLEHHHVVLVQPGDAMPHVLMARQRCGCRAVIVHRDGDGDPLGPPNGLKCFRLEPIPHNVLIGSLVRLGWPAENASRVCAACGYDYERVRKATLLH